jgi:hypothetical protein
MSAFILFGQEKRAEIKKENPDASFGEIGKLLGAAWKEITESDKKDYQEKAVKDKTRYANEFAAWEKANPEAAAALAADKEAKKAKRKKPAKKKAKKSSSRKKKEESGDDESGGDDDDE